MSLFVVCLDGTCSNLSFFALFGSVVTYRWSAIVLEQWLVQLSNTLLGNPPVKCNNCQSPCQLHTLSIHVPVFGCVVTEVTDVKLDFFDDWGGGWLWGTGSGSGHDVGWETSGCCWITFGWMFCWRGWMEGTPDLEGAAFWWW